jgi:hypothetical protein
MEWKDKAFGRMKEGFGRRGFLQKTGVAAAGFTSLGLLAGTSFAAGVANRWDDDSGKGLDDRSSDTAQQIFTAALIAEDLATTMYYNSLVGGLIEDPNLAGPSGSSSNPANLANVGNLQGAMSAEMVHANLLRELTGGTTAAKDPVQIFHFPIGAFEQPHEFSADTSGARVCVYRCVSDSGARIQRNGRKDQPYEREQKDASGKPYKRSDLAFFAQVASAI